MLNIIPADANFRMHCELNTSEKHRRNYCKNTPRLKCKPTPEPTELAAQGTSRNKSKQKRADVASFVRKALLPRHVLSFFTLRAKRVKEPKPGNCSSLATATSPDNGKGLRAARCGQSQICRSNHCMSSPSFKETQQHCAANAIVFKTCGEILR